MIRALPSERYLAWGRVHRYRHLVVRPDSPEAAAAVLAEAGTTGRPRSWLPYGLGRSYGDSCLNQDQGLIETRALDRFLAFDPESGVLTAEAGVTLEAILTYLARPARDGSAWFLPVSPGTRFVTLGGAIANDVHGKNHHRAGTFGRHVLTLDLLRSDGTVHSCGPAREPELFRATVGGLGLTGLILRATIRLERVPGLAMEVEDLRIDDLAAFYRLAEESEADWAYTVAWIDCLARGRGQGRGLFSRANHVPGAAAPVSETLPRPRFAVPLTPPVSPLNRLTLGAFNAIYRRRLGARTVVRRRVPYAGVFYPLDALRGWNRLYGRAGFYQYQCVIPPATAPGAIARLLERIAISGQGSFLAVLKTFGDPPSPGLLSFPMPGTTLALDFPNRGAATRHLLDQLDAITLEAGGRVYPAKDGRMPAATFQASYPAWRTLRAYRDPGFSSSFWRRVGDAA